MVFTDKNGNFISERSLAAIFAKANRLGIPESKLNVTKLTSINDEIRAGRVLKDDENKVIDRALVKNFSTDIVIRQLKSKGAKTTFDDKPKTVKIDPAVLSREERQKIRADKPVKVIDLIRKISNSNGIDHAEARRTLESSGVIPTGISDDAILQPKRKLTVTKKEDDEAIEKIIEKVKPKTDLARKISDAAIRRGMDRQKDLEETTKILEEKTDLLSKISDVQDERAELLEQQIKKERQRKIEGGVEETPLIIPGLISGVDPLKVSTEQTVKDKIRRRALDIEILQGKSPQESMDQAKIEVVRQVTS